MANLLTALPNVMRYTFNGQDARTTTILLFKLVHHLSEIAVSTTYHLPPLLTQNS